MWQDFFSNHDSGLKFAGLLGALVSLYFLKNLSGIKALIAVLVGTVCATYLTPLFLQFTTVADKAENGVAFLLGVFSMNLVGGIFKVSEKFRDKPIETFKKLKKIKK